MSKFVGKSIPRYIYPRITPKYTIFSSCYIFHVVEEKNIPRDGIFRDQLHDILVCLLLLQICLFCLDLEIKTNLKRIKTNLLLTYI